MFAEDARLNELIQQRTLELQASETRFQNIVAISTDGIVIVDGFGIILFVNPAAASLFGREAEQLLGEQFGFPIVGGETTELDIAGRGGGVTIAEMRVVVTQWEENPAYLATLRDITERRNAELYRAMMQSPSNLNLIVTDASGTIEYVNPRFTETTGYETAEVVGKNPSMLKSDKTSAEQYIKMWETITAGHEWHGELINRKKNGQLYQEAVSIVPVTDSAGTITHFFAVTEDITHRKLLETEIQDAREYAENIVETVREPLVVLNANLKILTANLSFYDTFQVTPEATIGNFIYDLGNRQWDIPKLRVLFEEILPHDTVINGYEVEHDFPGIGRKIVLLNARQIFRENIGSHIILLAMEDITERKRWASEIQDAREYAENIVETVIEPLVVLNAELKILTVNHSFYDTFHVTPEETIGNFIYELGSRQWDIPKLRVLFEEILPHDTVINGYEVEHDFPGIGRKIVLLSARQIFRENIGSHIILLALEDITERKRLAAEIQDAREYAENIVETVREPLVVLNSELRILTANLSFYDTFKVRSEETIGSFIYDLGNRQWDIPGLRVLFEEILPHDTVINGYEVSHDFLDIGRKIILLNARQIFRKDIGSNIILLAMEDITERKRLAAEIQDAREYAENIVETVREPLVVLNSELKILTANHSFYDTFQVTPEETIGNFIYDLGNRQWDIPKLRVLFEKMLPHNTVLNGYEVEHDFLDIGRKIILLNARQIFRENIGSHIILLAMEDITKRKHAEEEIKRLNLSLAERAAELEAANRELETFNYTVAHDLRQPLNLMGMYCQSLKLLCGDQLKAECTGYVEDAYKATLRMDGLIGALLNFSRMGSVEPQREMVDLSMLAHEVAKALKLTEPERQVDFKIANGVVANGDANLLRAVLDNLLGNAWKYSYMREKAVIEFGVREVHGTPTYFIRDNGAGFDMAATAKLFAPFQRLPGAENQRGFGIGLATVERIISRHGGKVWAEGEPDKGACIYFTLTADRVQSEP